MITTPDFLTEFDDDITASESIPYAQVQNPKNLSLSEIRQYNVPWGIFVPTDQAELVELATLDYFTPTRLIFDQDTPQQREIDGFLTQHIRFVLIHRSAAIEVQEKMNNGWKYIGEAYKKGKITKYGELASKDRESYKLRTRYLLLFLDENNSPLHHIPLRLGLGAGTGGSLSEEIKVFRGEIERVFFKLRKQPQKALSDRAHALTVLDIKLGVHKGDGKAPFVCPLERLAPAIEQVGVEKVVERRERKVKLVGTPIKSLMIPKSSETGQLIFSLWEQYQDFPTKFQDEVGEDGDGEEDEEYDF
ncbi:MAG: DUF5895 domain-containing protein [Crocosphaera sp.]|uniref:DUF5895 domain-containing protein n=1 Tax=Crocosphaera sp. TaxID=2729996 RepID=UPI002586B0D5|nr:DUF5895 domain-containing protein [Crocosphaera sp.]MCH2248123.1 DUF5895 domain-containing protein [Crocosphaera sp.]